MATVQSPLVFTDILNQAHIEPSVSVRTVFDQSTPKRFIAINDIIVPGLYEGGPPNVMVPYVNTQELKRIYDPLNTHSLSTELIGYMDAPSGDLNVRGAYRIWPLRLGTPVAASLTLQSALPADVLLITARDAGAYTNANSVEVGSGTVVGKRLTLRLNQELLVLDNLQNSLHLSYVGNGSAAGLTITRVADVATRLQTTLTGATDGSIALDLDLTIDQFATVQQLAAHINSLNGYRASLDRYGAPLLATSELDAVSAQTIRTPVALLLQYTGTGSACTLTTTDTTLATTVTAGSPGESLAIDLTDPATDTLGKLIAYIDALPGYTCTLGPHADPDPFARALLTHVTTQDVRTAAYSLTAQAGAMSFVTTAALGSILTAINVRSPRLTATRVAGATAAPANLAQTFLHGGTSPVLTVSDWSNALQVIEQQDLQGGILFPVSSSAIVQDMVLAWIKDQHDRIGNAYRGFFGTPDNTSVADLKSIAMGYNSTFGLMIGQAVNAASGVTELAPLYPAAMACGAAAGALPTQSLTNMPLRCRSLPARAKLTQGVREDLLNSGVCVLREIPGRGVVIALAVTLSLSADRIDRMLSESMARDTIVQTIRTYVLPAIPRWASLTLLAEVKGLVIDALDALVVQGILVAGRDASGRTLPPYLPHQVSAQGGVLDISVHVLIGGEIDHINVSLTMGYQQITAESDAAA
jgi:hypothetical protein